MCFQNHLNLAAEVRRNIFGQIKIKIVSCVKDLGVACDVI